MLHAEGQYLTIQVNKKTEVVSTDNTVEVKKTEEGETTVFDLSVEDTTDIQSESLTVSKEDNVTNIESNWVNAKVGGAYLKTAKNEDDDYELGYGAVAEGSSTVASGSYSHAEGSQSEALGNCAHAEGFSTHATADDSHAEGSATRAEGASSHAEGTSTVAEGLYSHAENFSTRSRGDSSHAEGKNTFAGGFYSHAEGQGQSEDINLTYLQNDEFECDGDFSFCQFLSVDGVIYDSTLQSYDGTTTRFVIPNLAHENCEATVFYGALGASSHSEGLFTIAKGNNSHAEGESTKAFQGGAHAEGINTIANGYGSHAEGSNTYAEGRAHAEGGDTKAFGYHSHAEGQGSVAYDESHAEGVYSKAVGQECHAEGYETFAIGQHAHAEGTGNTYDTIETLTFDTYSKEGNCIVNGDLRPYEYNGYFQCLFVLSTYQVADKIVKGIFVSYDEQTNKTTIKLQRIQPTAYFDDIPDSAETLGVFIYGAFGGHSHSEGLQTWAGGEASHAEGEYTRTINQGEHASGRGNVSIKADRANGVAGTLFTIGNGYWDSETSEYVRQNAMRLDDDGAFYLPQLKQGAGTLQPVSLDENGQIVIGGGGAGINILSVNDII